MKHILLISQYFYPEMISTGHILTELLVELTKKGVKGSVICAQPTYYSRERVNPRMVYEGVKIIRTRNTQYDKNSPKGKIFNSASFLLHAAVLSLKLDTEGPVLAVTNPPFLGIVGPILKRIRGRSFILIIHDLYPDIAVNMGYLKAGSPITALWKLANQWVFRKASFIVVLGRDMRSLLRSQLPGKEGDKVVYIPNWADPAIISPIERGENPFIKSLGLENKFLVQYSGNMGLTHDMETIVEAAHELREDRAIQFVMIGGGGKLSKIEEMARVYKLNNMTFLPYQPRENLKNSLGASDVSLISLEEEASGFSVPSKLYGTMASGRPIIANVPGDSEVAMTLREFNCGIATRPKNVSEMVNAIRSLKSNESERKAMGERAYKAFLENFTVQKCADQYYKLIEQITSR
jgi:glycosyltransferase involved in cell wall biosynthesis